MARARRNIPEGAIVHVVNRAVDRRIVFHDAPDYWAFIDLLEEAAARKWVDVLAYCLMPNHWHLILRARSSDGVSRFMKWLTGTHVQRYRTAHQTVGLGHLYQDRFKATVIEDEPALLRVMRYVEANAAKAGLTKASQAWQWSSAFERHYRHREILAELPIELPVNWHQLLHEYVMEYRASQTAP